MRTSFELRGKLHSINTSVNQLMCDYLSALVEEPTRKQLARTRLRAAFEMGLVDVGERTWNRDDLYER